MNDYHQVILSTLPMEYKQQKEFHEKEKKALQLVQEGATYAEAGRTLQVSCVSVMNWCNDQGIPSSRVSNTISESTRQQAVRWVAEGKGVFEVAEQIGVVKQTVERWCRERHVPIQNHTNAVIPYRPTKVMTEQDRQRAITLVQEGKSYVAAGIEVGVSGVAVWKWCREHNQLRKQGKTKPVPFKAIERVRRGESYAAVAKDMHLNFNTLRNQCLEQGVSSCRSIHK